MTTAARRRRSPVRSKALSTSTSYARTRAALGIAVFLVFFGFVWLVDGNWSADFAVAAFGASYEAGWAIHLIVTVVQVLPVFVAPYLPPKARFVFILVWVFSLPFGVFNVLSSAVGIMPYLARFMSGDWLHLIATVLGEVTAFLPERAFVALLFVLHSIYRGNV